MRINFVRSGGFAGMRLSVRLDTEALRPDEAIRIRQLVRSSGFFELDEHELRTGSARDQFQYSIEIQSEAWGERTMHLGENAVPDSLRPLLQHLASLARQSRHEGAGDNPAEGDST